MVAVRQYSSDRAGGGLYITDDGNRVVYLRETKQQMGLLREYYRLLDLTLRRIDWLVRNESNKHDRIVEEFVDRTEAWAEGHWGYELCPPAEAREHGFVHIRSQWEG